MGARDIIDDEAELRGLDQTIMIIESVGRNVDRETGKRLRALLTSHSRLSDESERLRFERNRAVDRSDRLSEELAAARAQISDVAQWTHEHGKALCPAAGSSDTFGDGMRAAKQQVRSLLDKPVKP